MSRLEALQAAMSRQGLDALLLGGEGAGQFAAGHTRIGVQVPSSPIPTTVVARQGPPHVVTADPDGAVDLPADHVHGMMWNPQTLVEELPRWLGATSGMRIGVDALSPGGRALVAAAIPGCVFVDATRLLAQVMMPKAAEEVKEMQELCAVATAAARAGISGGRPALYRALKGAFPVSYPIVGDRRALVAVRHGGWTAEARIGPGDAALGEEAVARLVAGRTLEGIARDLPPGVEVVGMGRAYEPPLMRDGRAFPGDLELPIGAVLALRWDSCGVMVHVGPDGAQPISMGPAEVTR